VLRKNPLFSECKYVADTPFTAEPRGRRTFLPLALFHSPSFIAAKLFSKLNRAPEEKL
jgi:hypothetical protein